MPALLRAQRLGEKAGHAGFDWADASGVLDKLGEELDELRAAMANEDRAHAEAELGDLLYAATSLARHLRVSAEDALKRAADRFSRRFRHMESALSAQQRDLHSATAEELDALWEEAKRQVG